MEIQPRFFFKAWASPNETNNDSNTDGAQNNMAHD